MLHPDSLTAKWIHEQAKKQNADPSLIEKVNRAVYLLERLQSSDLDFTFKGGTALMLLLREPKRFSIDLDIIVPDKEANILDICTKIIENSDFIDYQEDKREESSDIEKVHLKFYYESVTQGGQQQDNILLDILFEDIPYGEHILEIDITSPFGKDQNEGESKKVNVPTPEALLGDKLTAFAPNTTGIPYGEDKQMEIIKQLYDIGHLFDQVENLDAVKEVFQKVVQTQLKYRKLTSLTSNDVLNDIIETAKVISTRGVAGDGDYYELHEGIQRIKQYIFSEHFHLEKAFLPASKAAYLAALILSETKEVKRFEDPQEVEKLEIQQPFETKLNKLKKTDPEAFFYWYQVHLLLE